MAPPYEDKKQQELLVEEERQKQRKQAIAEVEEARAKGGRGSGLKAKRQKRELLAGETDDQAEETLTVLSWKSTTY